MTGARRAAELSGLLAGLPPHEQRLLRPAPADPGTPMLAVSGTAGAAGAAGSFGHGWLFERKLDGIRLLAVRDRERVHLFSRSGRALDTGYPEVLAALAAQACQDFVVDGELVALNGGRTDFSLLQQRMQLTQPAAVRASPVVVSYFLFDLLRLDARDTTGLPLRTRKALLRDALAFRAPLHYTAHDEPGARGGRDLLDQACARGWEGLVAKRADGRYLHRRSTDWQKLKCVGGQEFVIGGFTEPAAGRTGFGALLLGYYEQGRLRYAGKVGTGFDAAALRALRGGLDTIEQPRSPFQDEPAERRAHWVRPVLVAQVGFSEWTRAGLLRHPRFLGLRDDKRPQEVVRESR